MTDGTRLGPGTECDGLLLNHTHTLQRRAGRRTARWMLSTGQNPRLGIPIRLIARAVQP